MLDPGKMLIFRDVMALHMQMRSHSIDVFNGLMKMILIPVSLIEGSEEVDQGVRSPIES